jgi:glycosyltransferase involved in cell wall biosynthesis
MRILIATDQWFPQSFGGVARVATDSAVQLAARGHAVTVLTRRTPPPTRDAQFGFPVRRVLPDTRLPLTVTDGPATAYAARRLRASWDVGIAHGSTTSAGLKLSGLGIPVVRVFHASVVRELDFARQRAQGARQRRAMAALRPLVSAAESVSLRTAARVAVLSDFSRRLVEADYPYALPKTVRLAGAVNTDKFSPAEGRKEARVRLGLDPSTNLILTVRRLEPRMGLEALIAAAGLRSFPPAKLVIAGSGSLASTLGRLVLERGLGDRVWLAGSVPDPRLPDWYRAADVFVVPTLAYEGFGLVTAEALACGTPVVGTPIGATPEILRPLDDRLVTAGTDPESLAAGLGQAFSITDSEFRRRCRDYAVRRLSWSAVIGAWESLLVESARGAPER